MGCLWDYVKYGNKEVRRLKKFGCYDVELDQYPGVVHPLVPFPAVEER